MLTGAQGFFINGSTQSGAKKIIQCKASSPCEEDDETYYTDQSGTCEPGKLLKTSSPIKFCTDSTGSGIGIEGASNTYYRLNTAGTIFGTVPALIKMGEDAVKLITGTEKGYYLNAGSTDEPIIKYDGNSVTVISKDDISDKTCDDDENVHIGQLVKSEDGTRISFCAKATETGAIEITDDTSEIYYGLDLDVAGTPFGEATKKVLVKKGEGYVVLVGGTIDKYITTEGVEETQENFITCSTNGAILRYEGADDVVTNVQTCVKPCDLTSPNGCNIGYYLVDDDKKPILEVEGEGHLYYCATAEDCSEKSGDDIPIGYLKNAGTPNILFDEATGDEITPYVPYILCTPSATGTKCKVITIDEDSSSCNNVEVHGIVKTDKNEIKLCILSGGEDEGILLDAENETVVQYMVDVDIEESLFSSNNEGNLISYVVIDVVSGNAIVHRHQSTGTEEETVVKYYYTDDTNKILDKNCTEESIEKGECDICKTGSTIHEYEYHRLEGTTNYYLENKPEQRD